jgi:hypothetical protein
MGVAAEAPRCFEVERGLDRQYRQLHGIAGMGGSAVREQRRGKARGKLTPSVQLAFRRTQHSEHLLCARYSAE